MPTAPHGGDIYRNNVSLDFSVSLNPLGMPKEVCRALEDSIPSWSAYPDPHCSALRSALSSRLDVSEDSLIFGNGAAELIYDLVFSLKTKKALICAPTFSEYENALNAGGYEINIFPLSDEDDFHLNASAFASAITPDTDIVFLCNPNNPTGECLTSDEVRIIEKACQKRQALLCIDESFTELTNDPDEYSVIKDCAADENLCVLRAFTKTYALAGLRLGYMVCFNRELLSHMDKLRQPWSVSAPAQTAGLAAITEVPASYLDDARELIASERTRMIYELEKRGFYVYPSAANFILARSPIEDLYEKCLERGILIRSCQNFKGLGPQYIRLGLYTEQEDDVLLGVLDDII